MKVTTSVLRAFPDFADVPEEQLAWFLEHSVVKKIEIGDQQFVLGEPIDKLYVLLEGKVEVRVKRGNNYQIISRMEKGGIGGFLPYSRATTANAEGAVTEEGWILELSKDCCKEMSLNHYELTAVFVHEMTSRTREQTKSNVQSEKMMALGKLSAGLAHELNNPASAILRSAKELKRHLGNVPEKFKAVMSMNVSENLVHQVNELLVEKLGASVDLSLFERSDLEDQLEDWLEEHSLSECFEIIDTLVDYNFNIGDLEKVLEISGTKDFNPTLNWISNVLTTEKMVDEIDEASNRISDLVQSVKVYTHMDNAPEKQRADIPKGIRSTITMLNHKLKKKSIKVDTNFEEKLESPCVMVSEMNQVWTNLIDNAIDAMGNGGLLKINGRNNGGCISIEIIDNGAGIPKENLDKIFDPFFTTKAIGEGTGVGLEVVYRIINQHNGDINVESEAGRTRFVIDIPID